mgnify:CR=1 FL=1
MGLALQAGPGERKDARGLHVGYASGPLSFMATHQIEQDPTAGASASDGMKTTTLGAFYDFGVIKPMFTYARSTDLAANDRVSMNELLNDALCLYGDSRGVLDIIARLIGQRILERRPTYRFGILLLGTAQALPSVPEPATSCRPPCSTLSWQSLNRSSLTSPAVF